MNLADLLAEVQRAGADAFAADLSVLTADLGARGVFLLAALPTAPLEVAVGLGLDRARLDALVADGVLAGGDLALVGATREAVLDAHDAGAGDRARWVREAGEALMAVPDLPMGLQRWAHLARRADDPWSFAEFLGERAQDPDGVRWLEAARGLEATLGGALRLAVLRAARRLQLAERRAEDAARLRYFVPPADAEAAFAAQWTGAAPWGLHLLGDGGVGKTTFVRHLCAEEIPARGGVVARLDFDHLDPDYPERQPGLLFAHLAEELLLQAQTEGAESDLALVGKLADRVRERLTGLGADPSSEPEVQEILGTFAEALRAFPGVVVLIFDTCEELARHRFGGRPSRAVEETLRRVEQVQAQCPRLRVVFSGRWPLPARPWLHVCPMAGFGAGEAEAYLDGRGAEQPAAPRYLTDPAVRARLLELSGDGAHHSPFELHWLCGWVEEEPGLVAADLSHAPVDRYVEMRVIGRVHSPAVQALIPAASVLGRFDAALLAACVDMEAATFAGAFEALGRQEWIRREGGALEVEPRLRGRIAAWFGAAAPQARARAALAARLAEADWGAIDPVYVARWLALEPDPAAGWGALVDRVERAGKWGLLVRVARLADLPAAHPMRARVAEDGRAAGAWLGRGAADDDGPRPEVSRLRRAYRAAEAGAPAQAPLGEASPEWTALARSTAARLAWAAGEPEEAERLWRSAGAWLAACRARPHLYLPGVPDPRSRARLEIFAGLWPACMDARAAWAVASPDGGDGRALERDRIRSLRVRAEGPGVIGRLPSPETLTELASQAQARAHLEIAPLGVVITEEAALRSPTRAGESLKLLDRLRLQLETQTAPLELQAHALEAAVHILDALRMEDGFGFRSALASHRSPALSAHAAWRDSYGGPLDAHALPDPPRDAHEVLDLYEAVALGLLDASPTIDLRPDPFAPEETLRIGLRARALGFQPDSSALDGAIARLGARWAARIALDEAEHLALRLPKAARDLYAFAAAAFAEVDDAFGATRAHLGAALAAMAVPDLVGAREARAAVTVSAETPPGWARRAALIDAWLSEGGRLGPAARALLQAWEGAPVRVLAGIEAASAPARPVQVVLADKRAVLHPGASMVVGRLRSADLWVPSPTLSRHHVQLDLTPDGVRVRDLGSTSGTFVDGLKVQETTVQPGAEVRAGGERIHLEWAEEAPASAAKEPEPHVRTHTGAFMSMGAVRLRIEVPLPTTKGRRIIGGPIEFEWSVGEGGIRESIEAPLGGDWSPSPALQRTARFVAGDAEAHRLDVQGEAVWYPWEALLGEGGWLPCVRRGEARERLGYDLGARIGVTVEDREAMWRIRQLWRGQIEVERPRWLQKTAERPAVVHIVAWPQETFSRVRLSFERATEESVKQTRSLADLVDPEQVAGRQPPRLCILQLPTLIEGEGGRAVALQTAFMRRFALDLNRVGVPWVVVLPPLEAPVAGPLFDRLGRIVDTEGLGAQLAGAISDVDRAHGGALRQACVIGPD